MFAPFSNLIFLAGQHQGYQKRGQQLEKKTPAVTMHSFSPIFPILLDVQVPATVFTGLAVQDDLIRDAAGGAVLTRDEINANFACTYFDRNCPRLYLGTFCSETSNNLASTAVAFSLETSTTPHVSMHEEDAVSVLRFHYRCLRSVQSVYTRISYSEVTRTKQVLPSFWQLSLPRAVLAATFC